MHSESTGPLVASFPDALISIDRDSTIVFANEAALTLFGFAREEFVGRPLGETIIPPDLRAQHARGMQRFLDTGVGPVIGRRIDITACDRSGRRFPIELLVFLDRERPGERFHAAIRETSDRVARDAVVTAERERLRQILDATADAWWDCSVDGATRYSDSAATLIGFASGEAPAVDPASAPWIHAADRMRVAAAWRAHLEGAVARFECTHRLDRGDGALRWVRQRGRAVEFAHGRPTRIVGSIADVTEQQAAEEHLRNTQKLELLGLLAGGFAHDLNNMLSAIRGHAALAATESGLPPASLESLASIQLAATRAKLLTSNLLSLGKPTADAIERFPLRGAIEEAVQLVRPGFPRSVGFALELAAADDLELTLAPSAFQQALINLLVNARDAMPGGGRLRIDASAVETPDGALGARIVVEDTGAGMAPEVLRRIFEPFFTTKGPGSGTGLGLAVVQQVVSSAGGRVTVESDVGHGSRFIVVLPATRRAVVGTPATAGAPSGASSALHPSALHPSASHTVLLIEPHPVLRPMLAEAVRAAGFAVLETEGVAHAHELLHARGSSADGVDSIAAVVAEAPLDSVRFGTWLAELDRAAGRELPIVAMVPEGASDPRAHRRPRLVTLQKPFEIGDLADAIESIVDGSV
jgi:PAS domain S-box-containing protein